MQVGRSAIAPASASASVVGLCNRGLPWWMRSVKACQDYLISSIFNDYKVKLGNKYQSFLDYWTEPVAKGKMRYQDQKFFDIGRRVGTWIKNSKNFEPNTTTKIKLK